ncbi:MAG TPA: antibiotic biosynthesis monooxygenase [Actinomycetota bacterium]|nr:antibiotic biosynthesis monooxygenase [Actinomycetota bacterium]
MAAAFVRHRVRDYDEWRKVYEAVQARADEFGIREEAVYRSADDPNDVLVYHRFDSLDAARSFFGAEELGAAMADAGVDTATMRLEFYDEA